MSEEQAVLLGRFLVEDQSRKEKNQKRWKGDVVVTFKNLMNEREKEVPVGAQEEMERVIGKNGKLLKSLLEELADEDRISKKAFLYALKTLGIECSQ